MGGVSIGKPQTVNQAEILKQSLKPYSYFKLVLSWPAAAQVRLFYAYGEKHNIKKCNHIREHQGKGLPNMVYSWWYRGIQADVWPKPQLPPEPDFFKIEHPKDEVKCPEGYFPGWPPRKMTIHGLWPSVPNKMEENPDGYKTEAYRKKWRIDDRAMLAAVKLNQDLRRVMPDLVSETHAGQDILTSENPWKNDPPGNKVNNWMRQWYKHGVRTVKRAKDVGCELDNEVKYFQKMVDLYKEFDAENLIRPGGGKFVVDYGSYHSQKAVKDRIVERLNEAIRGTGRKPVEESHIQLICSVLTTDRYDHQNTQRATGRKSKAQLKEEASKRPNRKFNMDHSMYDMEGRPYTSKPGLDKDRQLNKADAYLSEVYICLDMKSWDTVPCMMTVQARDSCGDTVNIP